MRTIQLRHSTAVSAAEFVHHFVMQVSVGDPSAVFDAARSGSPFL
jgi:hypothetical protein